MYSEKAFGLSITRPKLSHFDNYNLRATTTTTKSPNTLYQATKSRWPSNTLPDFIVHMTLITYEDAVARLRIVDVWEIPSDDEFSSAWEEQTVPTQL